MAPKKKPRIEVRKRRQFRFNDLEFARIQKAAKEVGMNPTHFARVVLLEQADAILEPKKAS